MSPFKSSLRGSVLPTVTIFACALVMVLCSRVALGLLEARGALSYVYATSGSGSILEQMCEIFTGTSVVALVAIGGIVGGMIAALFGSAGWRFAQGIAQDQAPGAAPSDKASAGGARGALMPQFAVFALWMLVATLVIVAVFALVFLGTVSDVQLASVTGKLGDAGSSGSSLMLPLVLLMLWTLLSMGGAVVFAAVSAARRARRGPFARAVFLVAATALVGILLLLLSVALFARFNVADIDYAALNAWLGASIAANLAVTAGALGLSRFLLGRG
ncbi:MAG: hypothetical protein LBL86_10245 [Coriobacteriales bacterium]|jgi:hypothetical protein|nr:hypothetical protein [Coriobacteriales bacterium]